MVASAARSPPRTDGRLPRRSARSSAPPRCSRTASPDVRDPRSRARTAPRRAAPRLRCSSCGLMSPCVECRKVRSSAWPTSCARTRPSRRPWAMSSVIASPESARPRWAATTRRARGADTRMRCDRPANSVTPNASPSLGSCLRSSRSWKTTGSVTSASLSPSPLPGHVDAFAAPDVTQLLRHGVPGHAADRVLHRPARAGPGSPGVRGSGRRPRGHRRADGRWRPTGGERARVSSWHRLSADKRVMPSFRSTAGGRGTAQ